MAENSPARASKTKAEDVLGQKWDHCMADTLIKTVAGVGLGIVFSAIFFRRRPWPVAFGAGVGVGSAFSNCQHEFKNENIFHGQIKPLEEKTTH